MNLTPLERHILELIPRGIERRVSTNDITRLLKIETRTARKCIHNMIKKGVPIVAIRTGKAPGMFIPNNDRERLAGLSQIKEQTSDMQTRIKIVESIDLQHWQDKLKQ